METKGNANLNQRKRETEMKTLPAILIGLMASLAIGITTARGQVMYSLEDLGVVKDMNYSVPAAINNLGYVTGTAYKGEQTCAFHYDYLKKYMEDAGGLNSRGFGISSTASLSGANLVVGDAVFASVTDSSHAALFKGGVPKDLGVLPGQLFSRANGVNAMGQVVGYSGQQRDSNQSRAFMWTGQTGMIDIGTLDGGAYAQAYAINDAGFITGASQTQGRGPTMTTHAFIYCQQCMGLGPMRDLGVLGGLSSYGMAINGYSHVAGYSTIQANNERVHAFFHDGNKMIDLGSLGWPGTDSDVSVALGINRSDQVVGYSYFPTVGDMPLQQVAFLWRRGLNGSGQMINLNKLLYGNGKNYLLVSATAINDNGQIVATAYDIYNGGVRAVLLTPNGPTTQ
jgi:probable HAF family extracellular repeat protein